MDVKVVLTSVFCSALVSGFCVLLNAYFDRKARIKELIFKTAFELAHERAKMTLDIAKSTQQKTLILDPVHSAEEYHEWVKYFYDNGKLPEDAASVREAGNKKYGL